MRLVLDTNTVISGMLWRGPPRQLLDMARARRTKLYACRELMTELNRTIARQKFSSKLVASGLTSQQLAADYQALTTMVPITPISQPVSRDPDDDIVLACGIEARADAIVSGDNDLLVLGTYQGIPIVRAADILLILSGMHRQP